MRSDDAIRHLVESKRASALLAKRTAPKDENGCMNWTGCVIGHGYGHLQFRGAYVAVHRLALVAATGELREGLLVIHACDNRKCVNPEHLRWGTVADNSRDMAVRHRTVPPRKTSDDDVRRMFSLRASGMSSRKIAAKMGLKYSTVAMTLSGHRAMHVQRG